MMLTYASSSPGIGGELKVEPEDFLVEEILPDGTVLELGKELSMPDAGGEFVHFVLQKRDWATANALKAIAKRLRVSHRRMAQAGTKDKRAVTTQLVSAFAVRKEDVLALRLKDITVNGAWTAPDKVRMGALLGNKFTIRVSGARDGAEGAAAAVMEELGARFPNYFGEQRFGTTRRNTHLVGEQIIRSRFDRAAMEFLSGHEGEHHEGALAARRALADGGDFSTALRDFPKHLVMERSMLAHLEKRPNDFANAFRRLPRSVLLLFVHAFQSHLFNRLLSDRISEMRRDGAEAPWAEDGEYFCGERMGFPDLSGKREPGWLAGKLLGYESEPNERERELLDECGVRLEDFRVRGMPEIGAKGGFRTLFSPLKGFSFSAGTFRFSLGAGCYATAALREFIDTNK